MAIGLGALSHRACSCSVNGSRGMVVACVLYYYSCPTLYSNENKKLVQVLKSYMMFSNGGYTRHTNARKSLPSPNLLTRIFEKAGWVITPSKQVLLDNSVGLWYNSSIKWEEEILLRTAQVHLPVRGGTSHPAKQSRTQHSLGEAMTDWKLVKMHYEVLGQTVQELSHNHNISPALINAAIEREGWNRHQVVNGVKHWTQGDHTDDELMSDVKSKAQIMELLRTAEMSPSLYLAETLLLSKITEIVNGIDAADPEASKQIKNLVECVKELHPPVKTEENNGGGFEIKILNHFGNKAVGCDNTPQAVQIGLAN